MNARYENPWYDAKQDRTSALYGGPEFIPTAVITEKHAGCVIHFHCEFGEPRFDVVKDNVLVARRGTLTGAKHAAETKTWRSQDWWKKRMADDRGKREEQCHNEAMEAAFGWHGQG